MAHCISDGFGSTVFRPPASQADGEVLLWRQKYPKPLREHRRPLRGFPAMLGASGAKRTRYAQTPFGLSPLAPALLGGADGGERQEPTRAGFDGLLPPVAPDRGPGRWWWRRRWVTSAWKAPRLAGPRGRRDSACLSEECAANAASSESPARIENRGDPRSGRVPGTSIFGSFCCDKRDSHQLAQPAAKLISTD